MNPSIASILTKSEGRYLDDSESAALVDYSESLLAGLDSMQTIERAESAILDDVVRAVLAQHPGVSTEYSSAAELKVRRDQAMVLRYASFSMLLGDPNFIYDKLAVWLRTILLALVKPAHVLAGYRALSEACRRHLPTGDADAIIPYIQIVITEFEQEKGVAS